MTDEKTTINSNQKEYKIESDFPRSKGALLKNKKTMSRRDFMKLAAGTAVVGAAVVGVSMTAPKLGINLGRGANIGADSLKFSRRITSEMRKNAASRVKAVALAAPPGPGSVPDYFGPYPNYANSPFPNVVTVTPPTAVAITGFAVQNGGSGYTTPAVVISGGGGTGATATARVANGVITAVVLTNPGTGYTSAPTITISDPSPRASGASVAATFITTGGTPTNTVTGGIRKFVDSLPGVGPAGANNLGQFIPVAVPDTTTFPGSDYYEVELREYTEKMHSDIPPTRLRGYVQVSNGTDVAPIHYLGPLIVARKDRPVRIKFTNKLLTGAGGDLFVPTDVTLEGAGEGPLGAAAGNYTQNRATIHLHGILSPWISDGTPRQWITPAGETTQYPRGESVGNVPDMPDPGPGAQTFYYPNHQSARLMFYHDHAEGITRLNVYVGEAAGYVLMDNVELDIINGTNVTGVNPTNARVLPDVGIPLVIQDKTWVPDNTTPYTNLVGTFSSQLNAQDPTWDTAKWGGPGNLWWPHVYMPAQNPYDPTGAAPMGRWHYAPWFWPPVTNLLQGPVANPYYDPVNAPWEPPVIPGTPTPSHVAESFLDTPVVNGCAYPYLVVDPKTYRFRILSVGNDRFLNLQWYVADPAIIGAAGLTEVKMVPATPTPGFPDGWPTDGRIGGVPDPTTVGPSWIQIGTEGGFLPAPVLIPNQPVGWRTNQTAFNFGNVDRYSLLLGTAERADVLVDFSAFAGKTLILYNDAPAAFPALDPRYDYFTGDPDQTDTGGAPTTQPGYGPNTRTIMQVRVRNIAPSAPYDIATLMSVFARTASKRGVFEVSQEPILIPTAAYNSAYNANFPADQFVRIGDNTMTFQTISGASLTLPLQPKAMQDEMGEAFDIKFGRMSAMLGLELPRTVAGAQNFMLYGYPSPPVDIIVDSKTISEPILGDGTQIWKVTHNGVDTHTIHFHLFNVQLINRVAWDGAIFPPDPNELGWKETVRLNPLEDTIVAMRPVLPPMPFKLPNSVRLINPTKPAGEVLLGGPGGFFDVSGEPVVITNHMVNFGHEYVYHCHLLAHEENDMMHAVVFAVAPDAPTNLNRNVIPSGVRLTWTDNAVNETSFVVERATAATGPWTVVTDAVPAATGTGTTVQYDDTTVTPGNYWYRVKARNLVGDTGVYPSPAIGFPKQAADSTPSNVVTAQVQ